LSKKVIINQSGRSFQAPCLYSIYRQKRVFGPFLKFNMLSGQILIKHHTNYDISGSTDDSWASRLLVGGNEIVDGYQNFRNVQGGGSRSGALWPLMGKYTSSGSSDLIIYAQARKRSSDDNGIFKRDGSSWLKIT
jgi:hypothetical protein